jgi:hypothetical protein
MGRIRYSLFLRRLTQHKPTKIFAILFLRVWKNRTRDCAAALLEHFRF